jgi:hypothetical protein
MRTLLEFIARISIVIYVLSAAGVLFAIRGLVRSRRRLRVAFFGLEREAAREQLRRSATALITLLLLMLVVYAVDNIVVPNTSPVAEAPTPTSVVFVTQPATPTASLLLYPTITPTPGIPPAEVAAAEGEGEGTEEALPTEDVPGCEILGQTVTSPTPNQSVSGQVSVEGTVNILNFQQYKFELRGAGTGDEWVVVGTYFNLVPNGGLLGVWDSTSLSPGEYTLRLVVHRTDGSTLTPCDVPIVITRPGGGIQQPTATPEA